MKSCGVADCSLIGSISLKDRISQPCTFSATKHLVTTSHVVPFVCARAVEAEPGYALAQNNLAVTLHVLGRLDEAMHCYAASLDGKVRQLIGCY
jgi:hypothetical protein